MQNASWNQNVTISPAPRPPRTEKTNFHPATTLRRVFSSSLTTAEIFRPATHRKLRRHLSLLYNSLRVGLSATRARKRYRMASVVTRPSSDEATTFVPQKPLASAPDS